MELTALNGRESGTNGSTPNFAPVAAPTEALAFRHVSKVFQDGTQALDDVSLSIRPGEMVSIVGPSGCGKSTLLRLASRLSEATSGEIDIADGALGYVFQDATFCRGGRSSATSSCSPNWRAWPRRSAPPAHARRSS